MKLNIKYDRLSAEASAMHGSVLENHVLDMSLNIISLRFE
jgi:hypothetical protein